MNNIGLALVKMNKYDEALTVFEHCMEDKADFNAGLNMLLCAQILDDKEKIKDAFHRILEIPMENEDEEKYSAHSVRIP